MSIFICNDKLKEYEKNLDILQIVKYIEESFMENETVQKLTSLIAYSWYFLVEGGFLLKRNDFDDNFFLYKWQFYLEYGLKNYFDSQEFLYVAGYTIGLHGFLIYPKYEEKTGLELMKKCYEISTNKDIKAIAKNFIDNFTSKKKSKPLEHANEICSRLFPSKSILDTYFTSGLNSRLR